MSKLTLMDFNKIKVLTREHKTAPEIAQELGFSVKTIKNARSVGSYYNYKMRYCAPKRKSHPAYNKTIVFPAKPATLQLKEERERNKGLEWKKAAIAFMAISTTVLLAFVVVEAIIIVHFWSQYVH